MRVVRILFGDQGHPETTPFSQPSLPAPARGTLTAFPKVVACAAPFNLPSHPMAAPKDSMKTTGTEDACHPEQERRREGCSRTDDGTIPSCEGPRPSEEPGSKPSSPSCPVKTRAHAGGGHSPPTSLADADALSTKMPPDVDATAEKPPHGAQEGGSRPPRQAAQASHPTDASDNKPDAANTEPHRWVGEGSEARRASPTAEAKTPTPSEAGTAQRARCDRGGGPANIGPDDERHDTGCGALQPQGSRAAPACRDLPELWSRGSSDASEEGQEPRAGDESGPQVPDGSTRRREALSHSGQQPRSEEDGRIHGDGGVSRDAESGLSPTLSSVYAFGAETPVHAQSGALREPWCLSAASIAARPRGQPVASALERERLAACLQVPLPRSQCSKRTDAGTTAQRGPMAFAEGGGSPRRGGANRNEMGLYAREATPPPSWRERLRLEGCLLPSDCPSGPEGAGGRGLVEDKMNSGASSTAFACPGDRQPLSVRIRARCLGTGARGASGEGRKERSVDEGVLGTQGGA